MTPHQQREAARKAMIHGERSYVWIEKLVRSGDLPEAMREDARDGMAAWHRLLRTLRQSVEPKEREL